MKNISNKNIVITGASSGIGRAIAIEYSKFHNNIIIASRNLQNLEQVSKICKNNGSNCSYIELDLNKQESINKAVNFIKNKFEKIDILINNAGISQRSLVTNTDIDVIRKIMEINYFGTVIFTKKILNLLLKNEKSQIGVISSISGLFGFPLRSVYASSKFALHGFFESLYLENFKNGLNVTMIAPGRVKTNVSENALLGDGSKHGVTDEAIQKGLDPTKAAKKIIKSIAKNKKETLIGGKEILLVKIKRFFPSLFFLIVKNIKQQ